MLKPTCIAFGLLMSVSVAASPIPGVQDGVIDLHQLQSMKYEKGLQGSGDELANKRNQAMREAALAIGAQHGYVATMNKLRRELNAEARVWDDMFPFKDLMKLANKGEASLYFLPPVIHESKAVTHAADDHNMIKVSNTYFEIIKKSRLVTSPPDWREYLLIDIRVDVSKPVSALLPKTAAEQSRWADWVAEGWEAGVLQASAEMSARIRNLGSDFVGMVKYLRLVEEERLVPSVVASRKLNSVNEGDRMHVNQKTFAITAPAAFSSDSNGWLPLDLDPRDGYRSEDEKRLIRMGK